MHFLAIIYIYAFIGDENTIIDIENGAIIPLHKYGGDRNSTLLRLKIDPTHAYVSDLDKYDAVKSVLLNNGESRAYSYARNTGTRLSISPPSSLVVLHAPK